MLAKTLEKILNDLFEKARAENAQFIGVEHLLRALLDDSECRDVLTASGAHVEQLATALDDHTASVRSNAAVRTDTDVQPTRGFQRTLQGAVYRVAQAGRSEVRSTDILMSLYNERESTAVRLLTAQGIAQEDLLQQLGESGSKAAADAYVATAVNGCSSAGDGVLNVYKSQPRIEKRLDALEAKLDDATGEIRDLAAKLAQLIERLPPRD